GRGDGADTLHLPAAGAIDHDVIRFKPGVAPEDVVLNRDYSGLHISIANTTDSIVVAGQFGQQAMPRVEFANGTVWDASVLSEVRMLTLGTSASETLIGTGDADLLRGLGGNDQLYGGGGNDILDGGAGNDYTASEAGDDVYLFGRGDGADGVGVGTGSGGSDTLRLKPDVAPGDVILVKYYGGYKLTIVDSGDSIQFGAGVPLTRVEFADGTVWDGTVLATTPTYKQGGAADDSLVGTAGADYLSGLGGNDYLFGDAGNDVLVGGAGDDGLGGGVGNDAFLFGRGDGSDVVYQSEASPGDDDVIRFKAGVRPSDVVLTRDGVSDYGGVRLTIADTGDSIGIFGQGSAGFTTYNVPRVEFADGTVWASTVLRSVIAHFTAGPETYSLSGTNGPDVLDGRLGGTFLLGGGGNDTLVGGPGPMVNFYGGAGSDTLIVGDTTPWTRVFQSDAVVGDEDVVRLGAGVSPQNVMRIQWGNDLALLDTISGQLVSLNGWVTATTDQWRIARVEFADGTVWDQAMLGSSWLPYKVINGGEGAEGNVGSGDRDIMLGFGGDDSLLGQGGDDILIGGVGNDILQGGEGDDLYIIGARQGSDRIRVYDAGAEDADLIRFVPAVAAADVTVSRYWNDLRLTIDRTGEMIMVEGWFYRVESGLSAPQVVFADGTNWDVADLALLSRHATGTE
ncbi:calcium-binding protein, partial [uncultured Lamprocystis sp.]|uniref:calcium-binding protein n=1 Tax=uncultured Lamprocystis sp. TaxID=543132 RepID=UPI0025DF16F7